MSARCSRRSRSSWRAGPEAARTKLYGLSGHLARPGVVALDDSVPVLDVVRTLMAFNAKIEHFPDAFTRR